MAVEPWMSTNSAPISRSSPPRRMSWSSAASATSSPTWRPNRSRMRLRSRSPSAIWLKPAWSSPTSLPSSTCTDTSSSPRSICSSPRRTASTGPAMALATNIVATTPETMATTPRKTTAAAT